MIILANTTDKISLISSAACDLDVVVSYSDVSQATPPVVAPFGRQLTNITTATTTDILAAPAASTTRTPEEITIRNAHATSACDVTVQYNANGTLYEIIKVNLKPGETLEYIRGVGWFEIESLAIVTENQSTADQALSAGVDTYLTGSNLNFPAGRIAVGTKFYWRLAGTKTAAGTAAWSVIIRIGTVGSVSDTARLTFVQVTQVQTAAIDAGTWEIRAIVRGPIGASCVIAGMCEFQHHLAVTGWSTVSGADVYQITSAAFDITTVTNIGLSFAPGASTIPTFQVVHAEAVNLF